MRLHSPQLRTISLDSELAIRRSPTHRLPPGVLFGIFRSLLVGASTKPQRSLSKPIYRSTPPSWHFTLRKAISDFAIQNTCHLSAGTPMLFRFMYLGRFPRPTSVLQCEMAGAVVSRVD